MRLGRLFGRLVGRNAVGCTAAADHTAAVGCAAVDHSTDHCHHCGGANSAVVAVAAQRNSASPSPRPQFPHVYSAHCPNSASQVAHLRCTFAAQYSPICLGHRRSPSLFGRQALHLHTRAVERFGIVDTAEKLVVVVGLVGSRPCSSVLSAKGNRYCSTPDIRNSTQHRSRGSGQGTKQVRRR